ncbi:unnamed protein product [Didymodactylos carnosus]|uniref:RING-type domain-containing protein n=1 Tax=Didymodactylos carnosus TaxID=1234261 RepID=A0A814T3X3_9BILA|nr:unnamed protein product [Didymodactylos carnosus]CAF3919690.1 unnamed protein product [Didymodactylos carnosus]
MNMAIEPQKQFLSTTQNYPEAFGDTLSRTKSSSDTLKLTLIDRKRPLLTSSETSTEIEIKRKKYVRTFNETQSVVCNQKFVEIPKRHETFAKWPKDKPLPAVDEMVKAGFFYSGAQTIVSCFYCNGSLQNWTTKENPTTEHARWFPHCAYIRQLCGDELFQRIQQAKRDQKQPHTSSSTQISILDDNTLSKYVAARLDLPISQHLSDKYRRLIIKRCYEDQLKLKLDDFPGDTDLHMACLILQKQIDVIDGKKEKIIIPSKKLQEITDKNMKEQKTLLDTSESLAEPQKSQTQAFNLSPSLNISMCTVCLMDERRLACMPCGHVATCVPCGHSLRTCPMCRRTIDGFVRVYI